MNTEPNLENIITRLNQLEKKNKRLRFLNFAIFLVFASTVIIGWQSTSQFFKVIETEKLIIKSPNNEKNTSLTYNYAKPVDAYFFEMKTDGLKLGEGFINFKNTIQESKIIIDGHSIWLHTKNNRIFLNPDYSQFYNGEKLSLQISPQFDRSRIEIFSKNGKVVFTAPE